MTAKAEFRTVKSCIKWTAYFDVWGRSGQNTTHFNSIWLLSHHIDSYMDTVFTAAHTHKAIHDVNVHHLIEFSPSALSLVREVRIAVIAVAISITTIVAIRAVFPPANNTTNTAARR
jgi:hypothetical protein